MAYFESATFDAGRNGERREAEREGEAFRLAMREFANGVALVTTGRGADRERAARRPRYALYRSIRPRCSCAWRDVGDAASVREQDVRRQHTGRRDEHARRPFRRAQRRQRRGALCGRRMDDARHRRASAARRARLHRLQGRGGARAPYPRDRHRPGRGGTPGRGAAALVHWRGRFQHSTEAGSPVGRRDRRDRIANPGDGAPARPPSTPARAGCARLRRRARRRRPDAHPSDGDRRTWREAWRPAGAAQRARDDELRRARAEDEPIFPMGDRRRRRARATSSAC